MVMEQQDKKFIRKQVGKISKSPTDRLIELNEFLKQHNLIKTGKNERIRRIVGPSGKTKH